MIKYIRENIILCTITVHGKDIKLKSIYLMKQ